MEINLHNLIITDDLSILSAMKIMENCGRKLLIVKSDNKFQGLLSIGDIQRAIIDNEKLDSKVSSFAKKKITLYPKL